MLRIVSGESTEIEDESDEEDEEGEEENEDDEEEQDDDTLPEVEPVSDDDDVPEDDDDLLPPIRFLPRKPAVQILGKVVEIITKVDDTFLNLRSQNPPRRPPEILPPPSLPIEEKEIPDTMYTYLFGEKKEK